MRVSISKTLSVSFLLNLGGVYAACNADNCYRAMFPCASPAFVSQASAFCATITSGGVTATNYPPRATAACGIAASRYVSACKCGSTCKTTVATSTTSSCVPTPTAGNLLPDGEFECGLGTWTIQTPDTAATAGVQSGNAHIGQKSFQVDFHPPSVSNELGVSARVLSKAVDVTPGVAYQLQFYTFFDNGDAGFVGVMINDVPFYTIDARDKGFLWNLNEVAWTAGTGIKTATIKFEFLFGSVNSVDKIDSVLFRVSPIQVS